MRMVPGFNRGIFSPLSSWSNCERTVPSLKSSSKFDIDTPLDCYIVWFHCTKSSCASIDSERAETKHWQNQMNDWRSEFHFLPITLHWSMPWRHLLTPVHVMRLRSVTNGLRRLVIYDRGEKAQVVHCGNMIDNQLPRKEARSDYIPFSSRLIDPSRENTGVPT